MDTMFSRRDFLRNSAGAGLAVATAVGTTAWPTKGMAASPLRVTHYGGPYSALEKIIGKSFDDAGFGEVEYEQDQPGLIVSKWQADPEDPLYDIGFFVRAETVRANSAGLVETLSEADVPLLAETVPGTLAPGGAGVAMVFDSIDVMYDQEAIGDPFTSWLDFWRPELEGKIMLPTAPLVSMVAAVLVSFARALGGDEKSVDDIFPKVRELKPNIRSFFSDPNQVTQLIERREIVAAPQYSARIGLAMSKNEHVARATPTEGVPSSPYDLVLAKGSHQKDLAKKYINYTLRPDIQKAICSAIPLTPANKNVTLDEEFARLIVSDTSKLFSFDYAYVASKQGEWGDRWAREIAS